MRDYRFDVARVLCMTYIVAFVHLYAYIHPNVISANVIPACAILCDACLGLFTFSSGYLLGSKYRFGVHSDVKVWEFYKKRILRIIPLFVLSAIALWLIGFNGTRATVYGLLCISPFATPRPMTLWYIPVILFCYCITPIISRQKLSGRIGKSWKGPICRFIIFVSYASMACYMFHRLFFWAGEKIYNSDVGWIKWTYMAGIIFPVILYLSYLIQKHYDTLIKSVDNKNMKFK